MTNPNHSQAFPESSARAWRRIKLTAIALSALMVAGIVALMVLAAEKGEDITGIVAPALLIALVSGVVATVAAVLQRRVVGQFEGGKNEQPRMDPNERG